jgi:two-component system response regulator YesN
MSDTNEILNIAAIDGLRNAFQAKSGLSVDVIGVDGAPLSGTGVHTQPLCALLCQNAAARECCYAEHRRAVQSAFEFGEAYSFMCHAGLLVACIPLADGSTQLGALLSGMTLPEHPNQSLIEETQARLSAFELKFDLISNAVKRHKFIEGIKLQGGVDMLSAMATQMLKLNSDTLKAKRANTQQLARIAERIHAAKTDPTNALYTYEQEKDLIERVKLGDRHGAKGVLNDILGCILFLDPMGSEVLKARLIELLAILSRAAAEAGVDSGKVLKQNLLYFQELLNANSDTDLCMIVTQALNDFLDTVCVSRDEQAQTPVGAVIRYIEENFDQEMSVDELAHHVHLSASRLMHIFQEEQNTTIGNVVLSVRLKKAKQLLLNTNLSCTEISLKVGYKDQSYFTRVFRQQEGLTPGKYRAVNRRSSAE